VYYKKCTKGRTDDYLSTDETPGSQMHSQAVEGMERKARHQLKDTKSQAISARKGYNTGLTRQHADADEKRMKRREKRGQRGMKVGSRRNSGRRQSMRERCRSRGSKRRKPRSQLDRSPDTYD